MCMELSRSKKNAKITVDLQKTVTHISWDEGRKAQRESNSRKKVGVIGATKGELLIGAQDVSRIGLAYWIPQGLLGKLLATQGAS